MVNIANCDCSKILKYWWLGHREILPPGKFAGQMEVKYSFSLGNISDCYAIIVREKSISTNPKGMMMWVVFLVIRFEGKVDNNRGENSSHGQTGNIYVYKDRIFTKYQMTSKHTSNLHC